MSARPGRGGRGSALIPPRQWELTFRFRRQGRVGGETSASGPRGRWGGGAVARSARGGTMNRPKAAAVRRPSAAPKPSGESEAAPERPGRGPSRLPARSPSRLSSVAAHPPPGDFIALGSKGQGGDGKAAVTLLKPAPAGLPSERKRDAAAALSGPAGLGGLSKRPKLSATPPLSALGRLAEAAVAEKRAISPSIKEPSVIPIEGRDWACAVTAGHSLGLGFSLLGAFLLARAVPFMCCPWGFPLLEMEPKSQFHHLFFLVHVGLCSSCLKNLVGQTPLRG